MADIVVTNQIDRNQRFAFYEVDNTLASVLVAAGIASYAPKKAAAKALPEWSILRTTISGIPYIQHRLGSNVSTYDGPAADAKRAFPTCPQAIIDELADAQKQVAVAQQNAARASEQARNRLQR
jgi:hypothetical protein